MRVFSRGTLFHFVVPSFFLATALPLWCQRAEGQSQSPEVIAAIDRANELVVNHHVQEARESLREADRLSNHTCAECYLSLAKLDCQLGELPTALEDVRLAEKTAGDDHILAADALTLRATLLMAMSSSGSSDENAKEAEVEFRRALSLSPKDSIARFNLAMLLFQQRRDAEGVAEMKAYVNGPFANPRYIDRAKRLIADPNRARALPSDDFSFSAIDGEKISKAGLRGKVVLLDFWATWCPACRESVPSIAEIHEKFAGRGLELVGISSDADEDTLRSFASDHHMKWPEFLDADGQIAGLFEIQGFPTYIVLGRGGTIEYRQLGFGPNTAEQLGAVINRELAKSYTPSPAAPAATVESAAPQPTPTDSAPAAPIALDFVSPPDDVENGDASNGVYRNEFLGLSYRYPATWSNPNPEMLEGWNKVRREKFARSSVESVEQMLPNGSARFAFPEIIFAASPDLRQQMPLVEITVSEADSLAPDFVRKQGDDWRLEGMSVSSAPSTVAIGKHTFFREDAQTEDSVSRGFASRLETLVAGHYRVTLEIRARSKQELDELIASAQSLAISKP